MTKRHGNRLEYLCRHLNCFLIVVRILFLVYPFGHECHLELNMVYHVARLLIHQLEHHAVYIWRDLILDELLVLFSLLFGR